MVEQTPETPKGRFVTFYSTEGGVGRSLAAYNMAALLTASGERTLLIDMDFDKPRLTHELTPNSRWGLLNLINGLPNKPRKPYQDGMVADILRKGGHLKHLSLPDSLTSSHPEGQRSFDFLPAGSSRNSYLVQLWQFQSRVKQFQLGRPELARRMRVDLGKTYDYILIDSPSGFNDMTFFTAVELSDEIVVFARTGKRNRTGFITVLEKLSLTFTQLIQDLQKGWIPTKHLVTVISPVAEVDSHELVRTRQATKKLIDKALPEVVNRERQPLELRFSSDLVYGDFPIIKDVQPGTGLDLDYLKLCQTIRSRFDSER